MASITADALQIRSFSKTSNLAKDPLFSHLHEWKSHERSPKERAKLSFERCIAIARAYGLTFNDITAPSSSFWLSHRDPILALDGAAATLFTIQYNLVLGTLCAYLPFRHDPEFRILLEKMLRMEINGQFYLTEIGHGLDAENLETSATWVSGSSANSQEKGHWILHTPRPEAGKYMPPTAPCGVRVSYVAIVFAKMIIGDEDHGIRPFLVNIHDGENMCEGVSTRLLPPRGGSNPVLHSITYFDHVELPAGALLESPTQTSARTRQEQSAPETKSLRLTQSKLTFAQAIHRVSFGALALSLVAISGLKFGATIGWVYSWRRLVGPISKNPDSKPRMPIISFATQQNPILTAVAQSCVMDAFQDWATEMFSGRDPYSTADTSSSDDLPLDGLTLRIRHAIAAISKTIAMQFSSRALFTISERCGAQGLFNVNMLSRMHEELRGLAIAEGDILGVAVRLTLELLLDKYSLPPPRYPKSLLALHEQGLLRECREILASTSHHRSQLTNTYILPKCQKIVEAIGHRMAYDAAVTCMERQIPAGPSGTVISQCIVDLFEASVLRLDEGWYVENITGFTRKMIEEQEVKTLEGVMEIAGDLIDQWGLVQGGYIKAPIASEELWNEFVAGLETFGGRPASKAVSSNDDFCMARL
ncbi:hypothetical protein VKT23_007623 [Stygiomarasmius scandens]|uniref:Acyl-CoA oxidase C-alpha1 domain-containing protein n=1 Tax=Marasmiellus scandens TaxID=2682957 RepID=A0ABR1JMW3_9AGAR